MSSYAPERPRPLADASAAPGVRGLPWWAVVLLALVATLAGAAIDAWIAGVFTWGLRLGFWLGVTAAALLVQRRSLFTAMVQPPLVLVVGLVLGGLLFLPSSGSGKAVLYDLALKLIATFPTMAIGTVLAVVIGVIRLIAQPLRRSSPRARTANHGEPAA